MAIMKFKFQTSDDCEEANDIISDHGIIAREETKHLLVVNLNDSDDVEDILDDVGISYHPIVY